MRVAYYISGHGLGHSVRSVEVMREAAALRDDVALFVRTNAPRWVFDAETATVIDAVEVDTGVAQIDSLRLDEEATARRAADFYASFDRRTADEARALETIRADVVVGDIPPLAFAAAARAGIPSIAVGNFTWDWIYRAYEAFAREAPEVVQVIGRAYALATLALRLPLHGGFANMPRIVDIPLIARRSRRDRADVRRILGIDPSRPVVLASFGGYGVELPLDEIRRTSPFTLLAFERHPPAGLRYEDLVAAADVVVSKPGYGIVSDCIANGASLLYTSRGRFVEYEVFVSDMPRLLRCRFISQEDLLAGRWTASVDALLRQPSVAPPPIDGARVAARRILDAIH